MKLSHKIILLVTFLLCVLAANTFIGLHQISRIRMEFFAMADNDVAFMEDVTAIHHAQLEKGILLQKLFGITEELGFETVGAARKQYLDDQLKGMAVQFADQGKDISRKMKEGRAHLGQAASSARGAGRAGQVTRSLAVLDRVEAKLAHYDALIDGILLAAQKGGFQLSLDDLEQLQSGENKVTADVRVLLKDVQGFVRASLARAALWQEQADRVLMFTLALSIAVSIALAIWILLSIVRPLKVLTHAAGEIGRGNFKLKLDHSSKDEIAQVAQAFNTMSRQLEEFKSRLESQNKDLKEANTDLDKFIHLMGHDIVDPLTGMIAYCAYLEKYAGPNMDAKSLEALQGIRKSSVRMHQMVKDLIKFTESKRLENQNLQLNTPRN